MAPLRPLRRLFAALLLAGARVVDATGGAAATAARGGLRVKDSKLHQYLVPDGTEVLAWHSGGADQGNGEWRPATIVSSHVATAEPEVSWKVPGLAVEKTHTCVPGEAYYKVKFDDGDERLASLEELRSPKLYNRHQLRPPYEPPIVDVHLGDHKTTRTFHAVWFSEEARSKVWMSPGEWRGDALIIGSCVSIKDDPESDWQKKTEGGLHRCMKLWIDLSGGEALFASWHQHFSGSGTQKFRSAENRVEVIMAPSSEIGYANNLPIPYTMEHTSEPFDDYCAAQYHGHCAAYQDEWMNYWDHEAKKGIFPVIKAGPDHKGFRWAAT